PTTPTTTTTTVPTNLPPCYRNPSGGDQCLAMCNGGSCVIPCSQCRPEDMPSVTTTTTPYYPPTTTTLPYVFPTTTTLPYFPTTTSTTLPTIPSVVGSYVLGGTVVSDTCGYYGPGYNLSIPFGVTYQSGSSLLGTIGNGSMSSSGAVNAGGSWYLISDPVCDSYSCYQPNMSASSATVPSYST